MSIPLCEHIKPSGSRCASPAMRGQHYCFYHAGARACLPVRGMFWKKSPDLPDAPRMATFPIPFLEDAAAIQIGYMQTLYALTSAEFDPKQARLALAALDGARRNLKQMEACIAAAASVSDKDNRATARGRASDPRRLKRSAGKASDQ